MTWNGHRLTVDLTTDSKYTTKMLSNDGQSRCCPTKKKGPLLKAMLSLIVIGIGVQAIHFSLTLYSLRSWNVREMDANTAPTDEAQHGDVTTQPDDIIQQPDDITEQTVIQKTKAVIYSYLGIEDLPQGDVIAYILQHHPQVFYVHQLEWWINKVSPTFPKYNQRNIRQNINDVLACDHRLLSKFHQASLQLTEGPLRHHSGGCRSVNCVSQADRCESKAVTVVDIYKKPGKDLQDVLIPNDTVKFVHLVANPRFVVQNLWLRQKKDMSNEQFSVVKDTPVIKQAAREYCTELMRDIRTIKKLRHGELSQRYLFIRYEDLITDPLTWTLKLFEHLQINMTEGMREKAELMATVDLNLLDEDISLYVREITDNVCQRPMKMLGYSTKNETNEKVMPWWMK